jgi:cytochrome c553
MIRLKEFPLRMTAAILGVIALGGAVFGLAFAYSGIYNVAATDGHSAVSERLLRLGMRRSVETHSLGIDAPPLDRPARVALGASYFPIGCGRCHGAPGEPVNALHRGMLPEPPKLSGKVPEWTDAQLFWIVKHGLKYTGMPAWSGHGRDDEVWTVVAFLRQMPSLEEAAYRALAVSRSEVPISAERLVEWGPPRANLAACVRCHESAGMPPVSDLVPRLSGQTAAYLAESLQRYRVGSRPSGFMQPVATELTDEQIVALAEYYAALDADASSAHASDDAADEALLTLGRSLAEGGDPAAEVPACGSCHGAGVRADYPRLAGQPASYIEAQLRLWQNGGRRLYPAGRIMAEIAGRLDPSQIEAVAAYYQSLPAGAAETAAGTPRPAE